MWQADDMRDAVHRELVCNKVIGHVRSLVIECHREWELEGCSRRSRTDKDTGVGE
jgi:hypothetical protein